jgi:hypothetical protein
MTKVRTLANNFIKDARKLFPKDGWIFCPYDIHKNVVVLEIHVYFIFNHKMPWGLGGIFTPISSPMKSLTGENFLWFFLTYMYEEISYRLFSSVSVSLICSMWEKVSHLLFHIPSHFIYKWDSSFSFCLKWDILLH